MKTVCKPFFQKTSETQNAPFFDEECATAKDKMKKALKKFRTAVKDDKRNNLATQRLQSDNSSTIDARLSEFQVAKFQYKDLIKSKKKKFILEREALAQSFTRDNNKFWEFYKKNKS